MEGVIAKYLHPVDESLTRLFYRLYRKSIKGTRYTDIIKNLTKIATSSRYAVGQSLIEGKKFEKMFNSGTASYERKAVEGTERWSNLIRSHVPYVRNGHIVPEMISTDVREHD